VLEDVVLLALEVPVESALPEDVALPDPFVFVEFEEAVASEPLPVLVAVAVAVELPDAASVDLAFLVLEDWGLLVLSLGLELGGGKGEKDCDEEVGELHDGVSLGVYGA
jgi:hypothetical protein